VFKFDFGVGGTELLELIVGNDGDRLEVDDEACRGN
jgi:hypothetical protein